MNKGTILGLAVAAVGGTAMFAAQDAQEAAALTEDMVEAMSPGPMHAKLETLIGEWSMAAKYRMSPDTPWEEFSADVEREWILGNRFVKETVKSEWMGEPFEAIGVIGYDNIREEYTMAWFENMSTGMHTTTGQLDDTGKAIVFEGENSDAMTGEKDKWGKTTLRMESADKHTYEFWGKGEDGTPFISMEMIATRK